MMKDCYNGSPDCSSTAFHKIKHEYQLLEENLIGITLIIITNSPFRPISIRYYTTCAFNNFRIAPHLCKLNEFRARC